MRVHSVLGVIAVSVVASISFAGDTPGPRAPFSLAFKTFCFDTRLELPEILAAVKAAGAKEDPDLFYPSSEPEPPSMPAHIRGWPQLRGWQVEVAGQEFEVKIRTFDFQAPDGFAERSVSCMIQSFDKFERSGIAELPNWLGLVQTEERKYEHITHQLYDYCIIDGHRIPHSLRRDDAQPYCEIWSVELSQFNGMPDLDLPPVATAEFSTTYVYDSRSPN